MRTNLEMWESHRELLTDVLKYEGLTYCKEMLRDYNGFKINGSVKFANQISWINWAFNKKKYSTLQKKQNDRTHNNK